MRVPSQSVAVADQPESSSAPAPTVVAAMPGSLDTALDESTATTTDTQVPASQHKRPIDVQRAPVTELVRVDKDCVVSIPSIAGLGSELETERFVIDTLMANGLKPLAIECVHSHRPGSTDVIASLKVAFETKDVANNAVRFLKSQNAFRDTVIKTCEASQITVRVVERLGASNPLDSCLACVRI